MSNKYLVQIVSQINQTAFYSKYLIFLVIATTAIGINYYYSVTMMFLTTFILAYLSKGSRRK